MDLVAHSGRLLSCSRWLLCCAVRLCKTWYPRPLRCSAAMTMFHWLTIAVVSVHETPELLGVSFFTVQVRTLCLSYVCIKFDMCSLPVKKPQEPHLVSTWWTSARRATWLTFALIQRDLFAAAPCSPIRHDAAEEPPAAIHGHFPPEPAWPTSSILDVGPRLDLTNKSVSLPPTRVSRRT